MRVTDGGVFAAAFPYRLAGPMSKEDDERGAERRKKDEHK